MTVEFINIVKNVEASIRKSEHALIVWIVFLVCLIDYAVRIHFARFSERITR